MKKRIWAGERYQAQFGKKNDVLPDHAGKVCLQVAERAPPEKHHRPANQSWQPPSSL